MQHILISFQRPCEAMRWSASRLRTTIGMLALCLTSLLALGGHAAHAQTYTEHTLYSFNPANGTDGEGPQASLIDVGGILYGTTVFGGNNGNGYGTLFSLDPMTNIETTLHQFSGTNNDGINPVAALLNLNGMLFGTTISGGDNSSGTIFTYNSTTKTVQTVYSFPGHSYDGFQPTSSLLNVNGVLYGLTNDGGHNVAGTIYSFDPTTNIEKTLYSFGDTPGDGISPICDLINVNGIFYGTTDLYGGTSGENFGTIFSFDPSTNTETTLYVFTGTNGDGAIPSGGLIDVNGTLYGTTQIGGTSSGGTVFSYNIATNAEQTIYNFTSASDGSQPEASLIYDSASGKLFGTAYDHAAGGTVFSIDPTNNNFQVVYNFGNYAGDGMGPQASLLEVNVNGIDTLYGTTTGGGTNNDGTVFSLIPAAPIAGNDRYAPKYQTAYAVHAPGVLANDNNRGNGTITATLVTNVAHGTLTFNADGSFTYTPSAGFVGTDTFTYQAVGAGGNSNTATVSLVIQTTAPIAYNDGYAPVYNKAYSVRNPGVLGNDYNGTNQAMTATLVSTVTHGTLTFHADGSFVYTPTLGFAGTDSFTYQATNPMGTSNTAMVTLAVQPIAPIAYNDTYAPTYGKAYVVKAPGVLGNDDTGGSPPLTANRLAQPSHGTLTIYNDGSFAYTPNPGFVGTDTFTYYASSSVGNSNTATVTLHVQAAAPIAGNDAYTVKHNTAFRVNAPGVLANDYAGDSGAFTATLVTSTTHGTLIFNSDGSFTYTPTSGYSGTDTFTYYNTNGIGTSNTATVTLNVQ